MAKPIRPHEFKFRALIDTREKEERRIICVSLIDPIEEIRKDRKRFEELAKTLVFRFFKVGKDGGIILPSGSERLDNGLILEMESFEDLTDVSGPLRKPGYSLVLKVSYESGRSLKTLELANKTLEEENEALKHEVRELLDLAARLEAAKESLRVSFDAIKDLMISFDCEGNILIVNEACTEWFGQSPEDIIIRKKYKVILNQDVISIIRKVCESKETLRFEEQIGEKTVQITYIPMTNKKNGETEVVMMAQDITGHIRQIENRSSGNGLIMGMAARNVLNSSLTAILGFSQLALSSYDWPKATRARYLKLIERTALRMKNEIAKVFEKKCDP
jgi:PAS domain S-box-containing protein